MKYIFSIFFILLFFAGKAQSVESIHFHLYTDSLKKGTHNLLMWTER
ncbi:MAG: hypothetical protein QM640_01600 [Niabella sp.]